MSHKIWPIRMFYLCRYFRTCKELLGEFPSAFGKSCFESYFEFLSALGKGCFESSCPRLERAASRVLWDPVRTWKDLLGDFLFMLGKSCFESSEFLSILGKSCFQTSCSRLERAASRVMWVPVHAWNRSPVVSLNYTSNASNRYYINYIV